MGRKIKATFGSLEDPLATRAISMWVNQFACTTHKLELDHANNKKKCTRFTRWEFLAARWINSHAKAVTSSAVAKRGDTLPIEPLL